MFQPSIESPRSRSLTKNTLILVSFLCTTALLGYTESSLEDDWSNSPTEPASTLRSEKTPSHEAVQPAKVVNNKLPVDLTYNGPYRSQPDSRFSAQNHSVRRREIGHGWSMVGVNTSGLLGQFAWIWNQSAWSELGARFSFLSLNDKGDNGQMLNLDAVYSASILLWRRFEPYAGAAMGVADLLQRNKETGFDRHITVGRGEFFFGTRALFTDRFGLEIYRSEAWYTDRFNTDESFQHIAGYPSSNKLSSPVVVGFYGRF